MSFQGSTEWMQGWRSSDCWWQTVSRPGGSDKKRLVTQRGPSTGCCKKVAPKTFWNIFISFISFCLKFCTFVGTSYSHISAEFCRFISIFHHMALVFPRVPIVFTVSSFEYNENTAYKYNENTMTSFLSSCVLVSDNWSAVGFFFTFSVLLTLF